ncbi:hypothetical protein PHMEG_0008480 [Phytophthora megakarya]|uniref:Uncharacterized protein n=1 Tax=Phytophthora megakarya TaxID=4795 RepID=A0A225WJG1_9STRA|nr:hypothetical protein PHMEG_0008480 [Phytophthora megakarya]
MIEYAWPHPTPNFQTWYGTVMAASEYLASQMSSGARAQTWISQWRLVRLAPNMSADLTSVTVPLNELSMRECAAVLQTTIFEVGFKFRNLVPEWFRVYTPKVEVDTMRRVVEELQHILTVPLLEWRQAISGVQCRVVSPLNARNPNDHSEEMKPEDAEGGATGKLVCYALEESRSPSASQSCDFIAWGTRIEAPPTRPSTAVIHSVNEFADGLPDVNPR